MLAWEYIELTLNEQYCLCWTSTLVSGSFPILDEPSEGGQSSAWAHHDHWADGTVGQPEARVADKDGQVDHWAT